MLKWFKKRLRLWTPGLNPSEVTMEDFAHVDQAELDLGFESQTSNALRYIAGIWKPKRKNRHIWHPDHEVRKQARQPAYRLAAVRMLAKKGEWNLAALRMYAWTGYQKHLLPTIPLFAFAEYRENCSFASMVNKTELRLWVRDASQADLITALEWHDDLVISEAPDLHKAWTSSLVQLGAERLQELLKLMNEQNRHYWPLLAVVERYVRNNLKIRTDGAIEVPGLFEIHLTGERVLSGP